MFMTILYTLCCNVVVAVSKYHIDALFSEHEHCLSFRVSGAQVVLVRRVEGLRGVGWTSQTSKIESLARIAIA